MATLTIRNLPDAVYRRLRVRAAHAGRSLEAEVREILARAEAMPATPAAKATDPVAAFQEKLRRHYGGRLPKGVVASFLRERRREAKRELKE